MDLLNRALRVETHIASRLTRQDYCQRPAANTGVFGSTGSVWNGLFVRYSRISVTSDFINAKYQFGDCQNVRYSGKSIISESGSSENLCTVDSAFYLQRQRRSTGDESCCCSSCYCCCGYKVPKTGLKAFID